MFVSDILSRKPHTFNFIEPDAMVTDALSLLQAMNRSFLVVMTQDRFYGIFSQHDYLRNVVMQRLNPETQRVSEVMDCNLPYVHPQTTVRDAIDLFYGHHISYLPVIENGQFVGVVTLHNLVKLLAEEREHVFE